MQILVLGSEGQIGAPLVKYLKTLGHKVDELDILKDPNNQDLRKTQGTFLQTELFLQADFVFFLAFDVGGSRYLKTYEQTSEFIDNNLRIMTNVFSYLKKYKTPFIFASSQMANMNWSTYGCLKSVGEKYTKVLAGIIVHFWNVYGPEHEEEKFHVVSDFIATARKKQDIRMLTNGTESRQMLHVDDCCIALEILASKYNTLSREEPLCITSFKWTTIRKIADLIATHFGVKVIPGKLTDTIQKDTKNNPNTKIQVHWTAKIDIEEGIQRVIKELL